MNTYISSICVAQNLILLTNFERNEICFNFVNCELFGRHGHLFAVSGHNTDTTFRQFCSM